MNVVRIVHPHSLKKAEQVPTVMALGFFDGVHLGHQEVIKTAEKKADEWGYQSAVMTFDPHPSIVLSKEKKEAAYITPIHQKIKHMEELGVDVLYIVKFDQDFADLSPQEFVDQYLIGLNVKHVVAGFDYSYGKFGAGKMESLSLYARGEFTQTTIAPMLNVDEKISSTRVRELIAKGQVAEIPQILGRPYLVDGIVVHGDNRGRQIGFPTANVQVSEGYLLPPVGVYGVRMKVSDTWYEGMCNVGYNPTFTDSRNLKVEVYILDFQQSIYGEYVEIQWYFHIRDEKKFDGIEALVKQLTFDREQTKQYFAKTQESPCFLS